VDGRVGSLRVLRRAGVDRHIPARVRTSGLGLRLTVATHRDHAMKMSITSQHVSIVESRRKAMQAATAPTRGLDQAGFRPKELWRLAITIRICPLKSTGIDCRRLPLGHR
jgi:hypothetical protein